MSSLLALDGFRPDSINGIFELLNEIWTFQKKKFPRFFCDVILPKIMVIALAPTFDHCEKCDTQNHLFGDQFIRNTS